MKKSFSILTLFVSLAMCTIGFTSCSQMGLKNELTKYYQSEWSRLSDNFSIAHFKALILEHMNTMENCPYNVATERDAIAEKLAVEYYEECLCGNLADIALPYIEKYISVVDMKKVNTVIKDEKILSSVVKITKIMKGEVSSIINTHSSSAIANIVNGEEPAMPTLPEDIRTVYLPLIEKFYDVSGRKTIVENSFGAVSEMLRSGAPESQTIAENFFSYLSSATPIIMTMTMHDKVAKEELEALIEVYERPEFVKLKKANIEFSEQIVSANEGVNELFKQWLNKQI